VAVILRHSIGDVLDRDIERLDRLAPAHEGLADRTP
jgi:hypothetical protein